MFNLQLSFYTFPSQQEITVTAFKGIKTRNTSREDRYL
ncbi:replication protein [Clostridium sporogenes]|nr:replication protein [Clostridium sporogenes]NFG67062.1 replication protein [Clostridium sporogenes]NFM16216.1 replication protein [Clostridium sporogenes]NFQ83962.1 replication protein [Clostridium sporogenes]